MFRSEQVLFSFILPQDRKLGLVACFITCFSEFGHPFAVVMCEPSRVFASLGTQQSNWP